MAQGPPMNANGCPLPILTLATGPKPISTILGTVELSNFPSHPWLPQIEGDW